MPDDPALVDLDADGALEQVVLVNGRARVYSAGNVVLSSPAGWWAHGWATLPDRDGGRLLALSVSEPPVREAEM